MWSAQATKLMLNRKLPDIKMGLKEIMSKSFPVIILVALIATIVLAVLGKRQFEEQVGMLRDMNAVKTSASNGTINGASASAGTQLPWVGFYPASGRVMVELRNDSTNDIIFEEKDAIRYITSSDTNEINLAKLIGKIPAQLLPSSNMIFSLTNISDASAVGFVRYDPYGNAVAWGTRSKSKP